MQKPRKTSPEQRSKRKPNLAKPTGWTLVGIGIAILVLSIIYASSISAFIGLALLFWGIILTYIQTEEYARQILLDATTLSTLSTLNQIMQKLDCKGKAIYLPPKYFTDPEMVKAYIPKQNNRKPPTPEQIQKQETQLFLDDPEGILLEPPSTQLLGLLEKTLGISFVRIDLKYLQQNLPRTFIEDLEISRNLQIESENNKIRVTIEDSIYYNLHRETQKLTDVYNALGCPLSSALACALAKATGKPITIENQQIDEETKSIIIEYRVVEEGQAEQ